MYTGAKIEIESDSNVDNLAELKTELNSVLRPEPNSKFLGMHPGLFFHYKMQKEKPGFINRWLYKQIGEKPVYQSNVSTFEVEDILENRLENKGFFYSSASSSFAFCSSSLAFCSASSLASFFCFSLKIESQSSLN